VDPYRDDDPDARARRPGSARARRDDPRRGRCRRARTSPPACALTPPRTSSPTTPRTTSRRRRGDAKPRSLAWIAVTPRDHAAKPLSGAVRGVVRSSRERAALPLSGRPPACSGVQPHSTPAPCAHSIPPFASRPRQDAGVRARTATGHPRRDAPDPPRTPRPESPRSPLPNTAGVMHGAGQQPYPTGTMPRSGPLAPFGHRDKACLPQLCRCRAGQQVQPPPPLHSTPLLLLAIICRRATKSLIYNMILCKGNGMENHFAPTTRPV
jgi:hypothetical protein